MAGVTEPPDPKALDKEIGQHILTRRDRLGWSRKELADKITEAGLRMNPQVIYNLEIGERSLKLSEAKTVAAVLGVPVEDLLPGKRQNVINRNWIRVLDASDNFKHAASELIEALERLQGDIDHSVHDRENVFGFSGEDVATDYRRTLAHRAPVRALEFITLEWLLEKLDLGEPNDFYSSERDFSEVLSEVLAPAIEDYIMQDLTQQSDDAFEVASSTVDVGPWWLEDVARLRAMGEALDAVIDRRTEELLPGFGDLSSKARASQKRDSMSGTRADDSAS